MKVPKPRTDLPKDIQEALAALLIQFRAPVLLRLKNEILTREESRLVGDAGITKPATPETWVSGHRIIQIVARLRKLTQERALLELARSLDLIAVGRYELLRKAISEPVVPERNDVPSWNEKARELRYKGSVVRRLSPRAVNARVVLNAFQNDGWPTRIDSPLQGGKNSSKLRETVQTINYGLTAIKFFCDGTGEGICWQEV